MTRWVRIVQSGLDTVESRVEDMIEYRKVGECDIADSSTRLQRRHG